jgi:toxin FitB
MIILDTNVVSAIMKPIDNALIVPWLDRTDRNLFLVTSPTIFEIRLGIELMAAGRKRSALESAFHIVIEELNAGADRVLKVDADAADQAARIFAVRKSRGVNIDLPDTLIAAIAVTRGLPIATRNVRHFDDLPLTVINPWQLV